MEPLKRLPFGYAKRNGVLLSMTDKGPSVLFRHGLSPLVLAEVQRYTGQRGPLDFRQVDEATFNQQLSEGYQNDSDEAMQMIQDLGEDMDLGRLVDSLPESGDLLEQEDDAPIIRLINSLLTEAIKVDASDIHVETYETRLVVRFRVDGVLREVVSPRRALAPLLVSRIKVMARSGCPRTEGSPCWSAAKMWMFGCRPFRPATVRGWSCDCWINRKAGAI